MRDGDRYDHHSRGQYVVLCVIDHGGHRCPDNYVDDGRDFYDDHHRTIANDDAPRLSTGARITRAWGRHLGGSPRRVDAPADPVLAEAILAAEEAGYTTGATDCDDGAPEALGQPDGNSTVSVYLENEADAHAALLAFEARGVSGVVAQVQTFCLD